MAMEDDGGMLELPPTLTGVFVDEQPQEQWPMHTIKRPLVRHSAYGSTLCVRKRGAPGGPWVQLNSFLIPRPLTSGSDALSSLRSLLLCKPAVPGKSKPTGGRSSFVAGIEHL